MSQYYIAARPIDEERLTQYVNAYVKKQFGIVDGLLPLLVGAPGSSGGTFTRAWVNERVAVRLMHEGRGAEALPVLDEVLPEAAERLPDWQLTYSLALALSGKEMTGQRQFLIDHIEAQEEGQAPMLPAAGEPNSLVVLSLHALAHSCRGFGDPLDTYQRILQLRPNDPIAAFYVARMTKMAPVDELVLLRRCRPFTKGNWTDGYDDTIANLERLIQWRKQGS